MTDYSTLPDAEVNRRVAEAMGWSALVVSSSGEWTGFPPGSGHSIHDIRGVPDFCNDWQAFGRLWEHCESSGLIVNVANGLVWLVRERRGEGPGGLKTWPEPPRRALAIAFLRSQE